MPQTLDSAKKDSDDLGQKIKLNSKLRALSLPPIPTPSENPLLEDTQNPEYKPLDAIDNDSEIDLMSNEDEDEYEDEYEDEDENKNTTQNISSEVGENINWIKQANSYEETLSKDEKSAIKTELDKYLNSSEPNHFSRISPSKDFFNNLLYIENFLRKAYMSSSDSNTSSKNKFPASKFLRQFQENPMDTFKNEITEFISTHKNDEALFNDTSRDDISVNKLKYDYMIDFETIIKRTLNEITTNLKDELSDADKKSVIVLTSFLRPEEDTTINIFDIKNSNENQEMHIIIENKLQKNFKKQQARLIEKRLTAEFNETLKEHPEYSSKKKYNTLDDSDFTIEDHDDNLNNHKNKISTNSTKQFKELWEFGRTLARYFGILIYESDKTDRKYNGYYDDMSEIYQQFDKLFKPTASPFSSSAQQNFITKFKHTFCENLMTAITTTNALSNDSDQFKDIVKRLKETGNKFQPTSADDQFLDKLYEECNNKMGVNIKKEDFYKDKFFENLNI